MKTLIIFLLSAPALIAGEIQIPLDSVASHAVKNNPALQAARFRLEEARGRLVQTGRRSNPELEFEFTHMRDFREGSVGVSLMQRFPLTARLRHEKAVGRAELAAAGAEVRDAERRLAAEAGAAAVKLVALREQRALREKQLATSRESAAAIERRVASGEASTVDAAQFQLEARQTAADLLLLDAEEAAVLGELRPMLGLKPGQTLIVTGSLSAPEELPPPRPDVGGRPDIAAARHAAAAALEDARLARTNKWEDFGVGLMTEAVREVDEPQGRENKLMFGVKFSLPLPLWNKNEGRIIEADAAADRAKKQIEALTLAALGEASGARGEMAAFASVITDLDSQIIPKAREIEDQLRQFYTTGQAALADVLRATERRLAMESRRVDALRDYHLARIRHNAATGSPALRKGGAGK